MPSLRSLTPEAADRSAKLPDEIIDAHQSRSDFLKWKLILVAALGAAAFGLGEKTTPAPLLLALIPWVCLYVDLICSSLNMRQIIIGAFYARTVQDSYERFVQQHRRAFEMEDWALYRSSNVLCLIVLVVGPCMIPWPAGWIPVGSAMLGLALSWLVERRRRKLACKIDAAGNRSQIACLLREHYSAGQAAGMESFLAQKGCFQFRSLPNGLYPAAALPAGDRSGYRNVWVRDNIHIAHAHWVCGDRVTAARTAAAMMNYFQKHLHRFRAIIATPSRKADPMERPHIRFNGEAMTEIQQRWGHAQNDALGYFLWFYCKLARQGSVACGDPEMECLSEFLLYFKAIEYWQDADSGHWEEAAKVSASSIGTVLAGLREFDRLAAERNLWSHPSMRSHSLTADFVRRQLLDPGQAALDMILPCESLSPASEYRRFDGALLFLIYPLEITKPPQEALILRDIRANLQGDIGIRRYLGDSYWCPDYKEKFLRTELTADQSATMADRDAHAQYGLEAQWCLFDPILSVIYGKHHIEARSTGRVEAAAEALRLQIDYLNRSIRQLTDGENELPEFRSPEAYYMEKGRYVPNDHTPLLWSQANLWLAVHQIQIGVGLK